MHSAWDKARFKRHLLRLMKDAGLTQADVADLAGISRPQVSRWLTGAHRPNFDAVQTFASAIRRTHPELDSEVVDLVLAAGYDAGPPPEIPAIPGVDIEDPTLQQLIRKLEEIKNLSAEERGGLIALFLGMRQRAVLEERRRA